MKTQKPNRHDYTHATREPYVSPTLRKRNPLLLYRYQITKRSPPSRFLALGIHCDESANSHTKQATTKFPEQPKSWEDSFALYSKSVYLVFFFVLGQCHLLCE